MRVPIRFNFEKLPSLISKTVTILVVTLWLKETSMLITTKMYLLKLCTTYDGSDGCWIAQRIWSNLCGGSITTAKDGDSVDGVFVDIGR
jgi:hypothetical protein